MRIHSISKVLAIPLILTLGYILIYNFGSNSPNALLIFIPTTLLVILYVFHGQIDHWWHKKFPPRADEKIVAWLDRYCPFFQRLDEQDKVKFSERLGLYVESRAFAAMGREQNDLPYDLKCFLSSQAIILGFNDDDILLGDMDRWFLYKHPFPTPKYQNLHTAEYEMEDGVFIFSLPHALAGISHKDGYYNIVLHTLGEAYFLLNPEKSYPYCYNETDHLEKIMGFKLEAVEKLIGTGALNINVVHMVCYFMKNIEYRKCYPQLAAKWDTIFLPQSIVN